METCTVALYGCGTVGMGVAQALLNRGALTERIGERVKLKYVIDMRLDDVRRALPASQPVIVTDDLEHFEMLSLSAPDNRNMVLFPERQGGSFMRLERPFPIYGRGKPEAFDMWFSRSPDCRYLGDTELVLGS
jgi:predicted GH43/DUF377 family glycosyl hydrolase